MCCYRRELCVFLAAQEPLVQEGGALVFSRGGPLENFPLGASQFAQPKLEPHLTLRSLGIRCMSTPKILACVGNRLSCEQRGRSLGRSSATLVATMTSETLRRNMASSGDLTSARLGVTNCVATYFLKDHERRCHP